MNFLKVVKVKLKDLVKDDDIYPRQKTSWKTVNAYFEALKGGAKFPPIEVQEIKFVNDDGEEEVRTVILDGWHRIKAYEKYNEWVEKENIELQKIDEVDCFYWKDEVLEKEEHLEELRIESARRNLTHGDRLSEGDLKFQLERIVKDRPIDKLHGVQKELAKIFGLSKSYISELVGDLVEKRRMARDEKIYLLSKLGWTQKEIGSLFGLGQSTVSEIIGKFGSELSDIKKQFFSRKVPVPEIAKTNNIGELTAWRIILEGKSDLERFKLFKPGGREEPELYNVWSFEKRDTRLGIQHPGNIPGQIVMNVLYYYTEQGDLVVDPMAGGGTTVDACLIMNRKCRAYDVNPPTDSEGKPIRYDIVKWDIRDGFPDKAKNCDLIFLDPPYYNMVFELWENVNEFYDFMRFLAEESHKTVKDNGVVALLMQDMTEKGRYCLSGECYMIFREVGFVCIDHISCPLSTQQFKDYDVSKARKEKRLLGRNRDLYIFKKVV